jgi:hypothetical protein
MWNEEESRTCKSCCIFSEEARDTKNEYVRQFVEDSSHGPIIVDRTFEMERI